MITHSHGRDDRTPEIFTDDATEPLTPHPPVVSKKATTPTTPLVVSIDPVLEDEEVILPSLTPRLAADPWADVHPEPICIPRQPTPAQSSTATKKKPAPIKRPPTSALPTAVAADPALATDPEPTTPDRGGGWTIPMLCAGLAIIAACILVPLAEENHQLVYQRERLKLDLEQVQKQVSVNEEFLKRIDDDPTLAERLAQRQMKTIRRGEAVLDLPSRGHEEMSPFMLVTVPPPAPMPAYRPVGVMLAAATRYPRTRLFLMGGGLFLVMFGLVLGYSKD